MELVVSEGILTGRFQQHMGGGVSGTSPACRRGRVKKRKPSCRSRQKQRPQRAGQQSGEGVSGRERGREEREAVLLQACLSWKKTI